MRSIALFLVLSTVSIAADDPGGWSKAKWGMTDPQLRESVDADSTHPAAFDLAGVACRAKLTLDPDGKLRMVLISPANPADQTDALYQRLQDLLVQKYGRPWKSSEESGITELQWTFPTTVITLTRAKLPMVSDRFVTLQYKRKPSDLDKI